MKNSCFILLLISFLAFSACKKSSSESKCELSMSSLSGDYQMISLITKVSNGEVIDRFKDADVCSKDNMWTFAPNGFVYVKDIGIQCGTTIDVNVETWSLSGNEMHISSTSSSSSAIVKVTNFDCNQFSYVGTDVYEGKTYTTTATFKRN